MFPEADVTVFGVSFGGGAFSTLGDGVSGDTGLLSTGVGGVTSMEGVCRDALMGVLGRLLSEATLRLVGSWRSNASCVGCDSTGCISEDLEALRELKLLFSPPICNSPPRLPVSIDFTDATPGLTGGVAPLSREPRLKTSLILVPGEMLLLGAPPAGDSSVVACLGARFVTELVALPDTGNVVDFREGTFAG